MIHLINWVKPLPTFVEEAVKSGQLIVYFDQKTKTEYLKGEVQSPFGYKIVYQ